MRSVVVLLAAALVLVPGIAQAPLPDSMAAPAWSAGDVWLYRFNSTFEGSVFLNGTVRAEVLGVSNVTVRGLAQEVFTVGTGGTGTLEGIFPTPVGNVPATGTWNLTGEQLFATGSRKIVKTLIDITAVGQVGVLNLPFNLLWTNSTSSRVVKDEWTYPVPVGTSGNVTLNASMAEHVFLQVRHEPAVEHEHGRGHGGHGRGLPRVEVQRLGPGGHVRDLRRRRDVAGWGVGAVRLRAGGGEQRPHADVQLDGGRSDPHGARLVSVSGRGIPGPPRNDPHRSGRRDLRRGRARHMVDLAAPSQPGSRVHAPESPGPTYIRSLSGTGDSGTFSFRMWRVVFGGKRSPRNPWSTTSSFVTVATIAPGHVVREISSEK